MGLGDNSNNCVPNSELSLKVSLGNEIRRLSLQEPSYSSLLLRAAEMFAVQPDSVVLKYQDDDGDRITMSSDMEFQEAVRLAKQMGKVLRLFVEVKAVPPPAAGLPQAVSYPVLHPHVVIQPSAPAPQQTLPEEVKKDMADVYLGPGSRFGHPRLPLPPGIPLTAAGGPAHSVVPPGTGAFYPGCRRGGHGEGKHHGPEHHRHHHYRSTPHDRNVCHGNGVPYRGFAGPFPSALGSGIAGPAPVDAEQVRQHWRDERKTYKESKRAMKESWRSIKREAVSEEDRAALKELKEQMKSEMRAAKSEIKADARFDKDAWKALKRSMKGEKERKPRYVARHVEDVTIPDGTELPPNTPFIKTWKIRNEGPAWPTGSQLLFVSNKGDNLNGPERVVIKGDVSPGQEVEVSVPLITPNEPGRYVGYYRMVTPDGVKFGQRVWVSFCVKRERDVAMESTGVARACDAVDA